MDGVASTAKMDILDRMHAYKHGSARILQARLLGEISLAAGQQRLTVSPVDVTPKLFLKFILPPQPATQAPAKKSRESAKYGRRG